MTITKGTRVFTQDQQYGTVADEPDARGWFRVEHDDGSAVIVNAPRVRVVKAAPAAAEPPAVDGILSACAALRTHPKTKRSTYVGRNAALLARAVVKRHPGADPAAALRAAFPEIVYVDRNADLLAKIILEAACAHDAPAEYDETGAYCPDCNEALI